MKNCENCLHHDKERQISIDACAECVIEFVNFKRQTPSRWTQIPQTNADRIRAMSDEELEVFLCGIAATNGCGGCMVQEYCYAEHNGFADWVKQPVRGGEDDG